jgi:hypothetical protein
MPTVLTARYNKDYKHIREFSVKGYDDEVVELFKEFHEEYKNRCECDVEYEKDIATIRISLSQYSEIDPDLFIKRLDSKINY